MACLSMLWRYGYGGEVGLRFSQPPLGPSNLGGSWEDPIFKLSNANLCELHMIQQSYDAQMTIQEHISHGSELKDGTWTSLKCPVSPLIPTAFLARGTITFTTKT